MRERGAQKKVASGLTAYQQILEGSGGALPEEGRAEKLQQAETEFFEGLQDSSLSLDETRQAMSDFSALKGKYTTGELGNALTLYGTPEAAPHIEAAASALLPGRTIKFHGYDDEDEDGDPDVSVLEITGANGETTMLPLTKAQLEQHLSVIAEGPLAAIAMDPRTREVNRRFAARKGEADIAKTEAETDKATAGAAYSYASAEDELATASERGNEPKAAKNARTYVASDDLYNKLDLEYSDTLLPVYEGNRAGFDQAYIATAADLAAQMGNREPTPNEVLSAIEQAYSASGQ
jgi:hypothetical protein